jgi:hypothetical protein
MFESKHVDLGQRAASSYNARYEELDQRATDLFESERLKRKAASYSIEALKLSTLDPVRAGMLRDKAIELGGKAHEMQYNYVYRTLFEKKPDTTRVVAAQKMIKLI